MTKGVVRNMQGGVVTNREIVRSNNQLGRDDKRGLEKLTESSVTVTGETIRGERSKQRSC